jgi:hypothetical protein
MDRDGDIALAYSVSSSAVNPGLSYTGRTSAAGVGTMPEAETSIVAGVGKDSSNRYGDYHHMSIDPADDCTFWFTGMRANSNTWATQVAAFKFDTCGAAPTCTDGDGDGWGNPGSSACSAGSATDCNDANGAVNPGATEVPGNGVDDDCNPATPDSSCTDLDGDGYGSPASATCAHPQLDCNDGNAAVNPGATEVPGNGLDDDCNAATSDCKDLDGDGYGSPGSAACSNGSATDCNDSSASVNPGATEIPGNGVDDDCNSATPGGCSQP